MWHTAFLKIRLTLALFSFANEMTLKRCIQSILSKYFLLLAVLLGTKTICSDSTGCIDIYKKANRIWAKQDHIACSLFNPLYKGMYCSYIVYCI